MSGAEFLTAGPGFGCPVSLGRKKIGPRFFNGLGGGCSRFGRSFLRFLHPYIEGTAVRNPPAARRRR